MKYARKSGFKVKYVFYMIYLLCYLKNFTARNVAKFHHELKFFSPLFVDSHCIVKLSSGSILDINILYRVAALNKSYILVMRSLCDSTEVFQVIFPSFFFEGVLCAMLYKNLFSTLGIFSCTKMVGEVLVQKYAEPNCCWPRLQQQSPQNHLHNWIGKSRVELQSATICRVNINALAAHCASDGSVRNIIIKEIMF